jgi:hypothetical protein
MKENIIYSPQKYYGRLDEDMSDFAVGFYKILYKDILPGGSLMEGRYLANKGFAGDTMSSFKIISIGILDTDQHMSYEEWPKLLRCYHKNYHCLANFWLLPLEMGRTLKGKLNKARRPNDDYMDRFLELFFKEAQFDDASRIYVKSFGNAKDFRVNFTKLHHLSGSYVLEDGNINKYSKKSSEEIIGIVNGLIRKRACSISQSDAMPSLWCYFKCLGLLDSDEKCKCFQT